MSNENQTDTGANTAGLYAGPHFPRIKHPDGMSPEEHLRSVVTTGLERSGLGTVNDKARHATLLDAEIKAIAMVGFCSYFLLAGEIVAAVPEDAVTRGRPLPAGRSICAFGVGLGTMRPEITSPNESALVKQMNAGQRPPVLCLSYTYGSLGRMLEYLSDRFTPDCVAVFGEGVKHASVAKMAQQIRGFFVSDVPVAGLIEVTQPFHGVALVEAKETALLEHGFYHYQLGLSGEYPAT